MKTATLYYSYHDSPLGPLLLAGEDSTAFSDNDGDNGGAIARLRLIGFPAGSRRKSVPRHWRRRDDAPLFDSVRSQLDDYFAGRRQRFELPLAPAGTPFQRAVWQALQTIPYGVTWSYGQLARRIGRPLGASRAVGAANGANPLPIVIPCHRVIGADGSLTGFGGGLALKRRLLTLENARQAVDDGQTPLALFPPGGAAPDAGR